MVTARRPCLQAYKRPCRQNPETLPKTLPTQPKKPGTTARTETRNLSTAMLPGAVLYMCRNSKQLPQTARQKHASLVLRNTPRNTPTSKQPAKLVLRFFTVPKVYVGCASENTPVGVKGLDTGQYHCVVQHMTVLFAITTRQHHQMW